MAKVTNFEKVGQTSRSRLKGQIWWYPTKGLVTRIKYVKYECTNSNPLKDMVRICFFKVGQSQRSRSKGQSSWYPMKGFSQGLHV